jgi:hypothetical protein
MLRIELVTSPAIGSSAEDGTLLDRKSAKERRVLPFGFWRRVRWTAHASLGRFSYIPATI